MFHALVGVSIVVVLDIPVEWKAKPPLTESPHGTVLQPTDINRTCSIKCEMCREVICIRNSG